MNQSPHWPGVGRYVGIVSDIITYPWIMTDNEDRQPWQSRRVYQDELDQYNKETLCAVSK